MNWPDFPPRRTNRGPTPAPAEVIGRDEFVARLWHTLERESVLLTAQRRLGKSSVLILMEAAPAADTLVFKRDLENVRTPVEFVERVLEDIQNYLSLQKQAGVWFKSLITAISGTEISGVIKLPQVAGQSSLWKTQLEKIIGDLMDNVKGRVIFLWDELPLMLENIAQGQGDGPQAAMDVLDTLRALRQRYPNLRMVFTGSVGLHHVLGNLQRAGHGNASVNDMLFRDLPALSPPYAMGLAWSLLRGESLAVAQPEIVVPRIAEAVDCLPFYIHHLVGRLADEGQPVTLEAVEEALETLLTDPHDPCGFRNHMARIRRHYLASQQPLAFALLDALAVAVLSLPFDELCNLVRHQRTVAEEEAREALYLLESDHYISRNRNGEHTFRFPIIARAWRMQRGLRP